MLHYKRFSLQTFHIFHFCFFTLRNVQVYTCTSNTYICLHVLVRCWYYRLNVLRSFFLLNLQFYLDTIRWLRYITVYKVKTIFKTLTFHRINFKRVLNNNTKTLFSLGKDSSVKFVRNRIFWMFVVYEVAFVKCFDKCYR